MLWLGLIAYAKQDYDIAKAWWEKLYEIDPYFKEAEKGPFGSTAQRLLWNVEHNKGALFATSEQMKIFKSTRSRFAVLVADLELENVNLPEAERKFSRLLKDKEISTDREQAAYCTFALATAMMGQFKRQECEKLLEKFVPENHFTETIIAPRALLYYANGIQDIHGGGGGGGPVFRFNRLPTFGSVVSGGRASQKSASGNFNSLQYTDGIVAGLGVAVGRRPPFSDEYHGLVAGRFMEGVRPVDGGRSGSSN